jgi:hypothetical protein
MQASRAPPLPEGACSCASSSPPAATCGGLLHAGEGGAAVAGAGLPVRLLPASRLRSWKTKERDERETEERDKREGRTCVELFPLRFGRPCRSELSRGRNGKTTGVVSGFVKPLHAWRATSGHQPASGSLTWSSTRITPARSTFVLSHCDRHTGPTPTPVPVRLRLEV